MLCFWLSHICTWKCIWRVCREGKSTCFKTYCWWSIQGRYWARTPGKFPTTYSYKVVHVWLFNYGLTGILGDSYSDSDVVYFKSNWFKAVWEDHEIHKVQCWKWSYPWQWRWEIWQGEISGNVAFCRFAWRSQRSNCSTWDLG